MIMFDHYSPLDYRSPLRCRILPTTKVLVLTAKEREYVLHRTVMEADVTITEGENELGDQDLVVLNTNRNLSLEVTMEILKEAREELLLSRMVW